MPTLFPFFPFFYTIVFENCSEREKERRRRRRRTMEKATMLGVRKQKAMVKRRKQRFLKKVTEYLKSDCHLYAPLLSVHRSPFRTPKSTSGLEIGEPAKDDKRSLVDKVGDYMKFDPYMYAPLLDSQPLSHLNTPRTSDKSVIKERQPVTDERVVAEENSYEISNSRRLNLEHTETVKRMVYQSCRPSFMSEKGMTNGRSRNVTVD